MKKTIFIAVFLTGIMLNAQQKDTLKVTDIEFVTVDGKKKIIERKVDRLIYNVQNSMVSQGSSGTEVLANTPLLRVDEERGLLSIAGKSGVSLMVNDRMLNLSGTELMNYLKNLRSENISKIEVITTPPAKYEAQGNSGIINIILKKNPSMGWSGYFNTYYKQSTYSGFGGGFGINYQGEKLRSSVKFRGYDDEKKSVENFRIIGENSSIKRDERRDINDGLGLNASVDYSLNTNANVGFIYDLAEGHSNMDILSGTQYFSNNINILNIDTNSKHRSTDKSHMLNLFYDQKIGDHKLTIGANYYGNVPDTNVNFITTDLSDQSEQVVRNLSRVDYNIYSAQADLTLNLKKIKFETGIKYSKFTNDSNIGYFNLLESEYIIDPQRSNLFNYDEKNYAAYVSAEKDFGEKWSAKVGIRYEHTETNGFSPETSINTNNTYGRFFPSAYISYKANDNHEFNLNFSKRINRPYFRALNPFRWYSNPNSYYAGNPSLLPSYNHNFEFDYTFKSKFTASLYFERVVDSYDQITFIDGINVMSTYYNYYNQNGYGLNLNYSDTFFKFWETNVSTSLSFSDTQIKKYDALALKGRGFYYSVYNTFQLNKAKTFYLFVNYSQSLASRDVNGTSKSNGSLNAGVKASLIEKTLQVNLSFNDIFRQAGYRGSLFFADNMQSFDNYWDARKLTLSFTYNFGNQKVRASNRNVDFKEKNRVQ